MDLKEIIIREARKSDISDLENLFKKQIDYHLEINPAYVNDIPYIDSKDAIEYFFESVPAVGIAWILMGIVLLGSRRFQSGDRGMDMLNTRDAFFIGAAQGISFIPGVSRSGATILMGLALGLKKDEAARFSFWIAIPAIVGAGILKMDEGIQFANLHGGPLLAGFIASAITGFFTITFFLKLIHKGKFFLFGYYCLAIGLFAVVYSVLKGF